MHYVYLVNSTPAVEKHKILCIIDSSFTSCTALNWAIHVAQRFRGHLCVMFTYRLIPSRSGELKDWKKNVEEEAQRNFSMIEAQCLVTSGLTYEFRTEVGFISDRLREYAGNNELIFVVIDRKANINNAESIDDLVKDFHIPVLLIPHQSITVGRD